MMGGRQAWATLLLLVLAGARSAAQPADPGPHSIVAARWLSNQHVEQPPCPEPAICAGEIVDAQLADVRTLSGPRVPRRLTVRLLSAHTPSAGDDYRSVLVIRPDGAGRPWAGRWLRSAVPNEDVCIRSDWFSALGLSPPRHNRVHGDQTCFPA